jgi:single-stranded DNA-binding protein
MSQFTLKNKDGEIVVKGRAGGKAVYNAERNVTNFSFAVTRSWPSEDPDAENGFKHVTAWYKAAVWGNQAQAANVIDKGDIVEVSFHAADLVADSYSNGDGQPAASLKILRCQVRILLAKGGNGSSAPVEEEPAEVEL